MSGAAFIWGCIILGVLIEHGLAKIAQAIRRVD